MIETDCILVGAALYNWSETQRMIEISDELLQRGYRIVFIGEGKYDFLLENKGYIRERVAYDPQWYTSERIAKMLGMDRYGSNYATLEETEKIISSEVEIIEKYHPAAIMTGYRMSLTISAKLCRIPIIWSLTASLSRPYLSKEAEKISQINVRKQNATSSFQELRTVVEDKIAFERLLQECKTSATWNSFLQKHGLEPLASDLDIYTGDLNLMSDAGELFPELEETEKYKFIGPIWNNQYIEMPAVVDTVMAEKNGRKKVLISIGSGGKKELFLKILQATREFDCDFFVSVVGILSQEDIQDYPPNYHFCDKFPLIDIAKQCDFAIIQGGQGTVYAVIAGQCPFVSLPATFEQKHNIENLLRHYQCGEIIRSYCVNDKAIKTAVGKLLQDASYKENMVKAATALEKHIADRRRTPRVAADCIEEFLHRE